ncbi:MAG: N-acetylmuramoyl-L-alanine amidase [Campylobacteraceae bacterium]|jgi:N-acetylmuramoyl-L-alanine amidase|nr:N-acetylmuramoyl-L-alanine amidase [Campylobacteraceae bacterium]
MIKRFIFILLTVLSFILATDYNAELDNFDKNFSQYDALEKDRAYSSMQHLYINSIMEGNDTLKYEALTRIIKSSKELDYDSEIYEKELNTLIKLNPKLTAAAHEQKTDTNTAENSAKSMKDNEGSVIFSADIVKVEEGEYAVNEEAVAPKWQNVSAAAGGKTAPKSDKTLAKLLEIKHEGENITFIFDKNLDKDEIKTFTLKAENSVKYVYDINALKGNVSKNIKTKLKDIRFSQFDKNTTRVVFESQKEINITQKIVDKQLIFTAKEFNPPSKQNDTKTTLTVNPSFKKHIVIDAGHGGKDSGAVYGKFLEKEAVLQIALILGKELENRGYTVIYTRQSDKFLKLRERTKIANDKNADLFISLHANAAPKSAKNDNTKWQGIETFFLSPSDSQRSKNAAELENQSDVEEMDFYSKSTFLNFLNREKIIASHKLALDIQQYLLGAVKKQYNKVVDGGVREAPFWVLTGAQMPAVLLEVGYITDKTDRERMFDKKFQQLLASGIADGIVSYFAKNE